MGSRTQSQTLSAFVPSCVRDAMTTCIETAAVVAIASSATCTLGLAGYSHARLLRDAATNAPGGPLANSALSLRDGGPLKASGVQLCLQDNTIGKVALEFNGEVLHYTKNDQKMPAVALGGMDVIIQDKTVKAFAPIDRRTPSSVSLEFATAEQAQIWAKGLRDATQRAAAHVRIQEFIEYVLELEKYIKALKDRAKKVKELEYETDELKEKLKKIEDEAPKKEKNGKRAHGKSMQEDGEEEQYEGECQATPRGMSRKEVDFATSMDAADLPARARELEEKAAEIENELSIFEARSREQGADSKKLLSENERLSCALSEAEQAVVAANAKAQQLENRVLQLELGGNNSQVQELKDAAANLEQRTADLEKMRTLPPAPVDNSDGSATSPNRAASPNEVMQLDAQIKAHNQQFTACVNRLLAHSQKSEARRPAGNEAAAADTGELLALRNELNMVQAQVQERDALISRAEGEKDAAKRDLLDYQRQVQALQQELATAVSSQDAENMRLQFEEQLRQELANSYSAEDLENLKRQYEQVLEEEKSKEVEQRALVEKNFFTVQAEADQYKLTIAGLEKALAEKDAQSPSQDPRVMMYKQEADEYKLKIVDLEKKLAAKDAQSPSQDPRVMAIKREADDAKAAANAAKAAAQQASAKEAEAQSTINALKQKIVPLEDAQMQQNQTIVKLQTDLSQVTLELEESRRAARSAPNPDEIAALKRDYDAQLQKLQRIQQEKEAQMMKEFETGFVDVRRQAQEEKSRADQASATAEFLQQEKRSLQSQLDKLMTSQQANSSNSRQELLQAEEELRRYQRGAEEDRRTIEMLQNALSDNSAGQASALEGAQRKAEQLQQEVMQLSSDRQQLQDERNYLMKELEKSNSVRSVEPNPANQQIVSALTAENADLKSQLQQTWGKITEQTKKIEEEREIFWQELEAVRLKADQSKAVPGNITAPGQATTTTSTMSSPLVTQLRNAGSLPAAREVKYPASRGGAFSSTSATTTAPRAVPVRERVASGIESMPAQRGLPTRSAGLITRGATLGQRM